MWVRIIVIFNKNGLKHYKRIMLTISFVCILNKGLEDIKWWIFFTKCGFIFVFEKCEIIYKVFIINFYKKN